MTMMFTPRALLTGAVVFLVVGLERLLNAYLLQGSPALPGRVLMGLSFTAGGIILFGILAIQRRGRRRRSDDDA